MNLAKVGIYFPSSGIIATRSYLRDHRETTMNLLKAYSEGVYRLARDKSFSKKVIAKYTNDKDDEILNVTYQFAVDIPARPPYPTREGMAEILKLSRNPKAKTASPDDFLDMSLVKSLEESGFFK